MIRSEGWDCGSLVALVGEVSLGWLLPIVRN